MAAWLIPAAMMAAGLLKGEQDKKKEKKQALLNSEITRYSPWTNIAQQPVQFADPSGSAMQGLMGGLMMQQGMAGADKQNALLDAQTNYYNQSQPGAASPWGFDPNAPYPYQQGAGPRMP